MRRSFVFLLVALALLCSASIASGQDTGWAQPVLVSGPTTSWFPNLAVGPDGSVFIIWSSGLAKGDEPQDGIDLLMYRELRNGRWSPVNDIANPGTGGFAVRNSIALGRDGKLHILLRNQLSVLHISAPWDHAWSARAWSAPRRINNNNPPYYDALAIDSKGTLHAFWNEGVADDPTKPNTQCPRCADVFYRRSSDGGELWSAPSNLSRTPDGSAKPQIKIDADDHLHLVWNEGYDNINGKGVPKASMYRRSRGGGETWDEPVRFELPDDAPQQIALGLFQNHTPIVVYRSTEHGHDLLSGRAGQRWGAMERRDTPAGRACPPTRTDPLG